MAEAPPDVAARIKRSIKERHHMTCACGRTWLLARNYTCPGCGDEMTVPGGATQ